jgi:hypothetical protein
VQNKVEYISLQLGQLSVIENLPDANIEPNQLINRATDVLSTALTYLAVHIGREPRFLGVLGRLPSRALLIMTRRNRDNGC